MHPFFLFFRLKHITKFTTLTIFQCPVHVYASLEHLNTRYCVTSYKVMRNDLVSAHWNTGIFGQQHCTEALKREPQRERTWPGCRMAQLMNPVTRWEKRWEVLSSAGPSWSCLPTKKQQARQKEKQNGWAQVSLPVTSLHTRKQKVPERAVHVFVTVNRQIVWTTGKHGSSEVLKEFKQIIIPSPLGS